MSSLFSVLPTSCSITDLNSKFWREGLERAINQFRKYYVKILLGDFSARIGREGIFKTTIRNTNLVMQMFPHRNIHKFSGSSPDVKTRNHIVHILIHRRHSNVLDRAWYLSFGGEDNTTHNLVVAKVWERLSGCRWATQKLCMNRVNRIKPSKQEGKQQHLINFLNKFAAGRFKWDGSIPLYRPAPWNSSSLLGNMAAVPSRTRYCCHLYALTSN
jgi:hypothetical protein